MVISTAVLVIAEWWVGFVFFMSRFGHLYILMNQKLQGGFLPFGALTPEIRVDLPIQKRFPMMGFLAVVWLFAKPRPP